MHNNTNIQFHICLLEYPTPNETKVRKAKLLCSLPLGKETQEAEKIQELNGLSN